MRWPRSIGTLLVATLAAGCAAPKLTLPMTAAELARDTSGSALVAYLMQRDASPSVCDQRSLGPHVLALDASGRRELVDALVTGRVDPLLFGRCARAILRSGPPSSGAALLGEAGHAYRALLVTRAVETDPAVRARLSVLGALYVDRPIALRGDRDDLDPMFEDLRRAVAEGSLGPVATRFGRELLLVVDVERGRFEGQPVDPSTLALVDRRDDDATLRLFASRLPSSELRELAKRTVVRRAIARSPFPEVRADAAVVEERVMRSGRNAISLAEHPPTRARLALEGAPARGMLVRQHVWQRTATLLGYVRGAPTISVLPEVSLRSVLEVEAAGLSREVTLCGPARALDPSPCLAAEDVRLGSPAVYQERNGKFHFVEELGMSDAISLAAGGPQVALPIEVGGHVLAELPWQLRYESPGDVIFSGAMPGARGPDVRVTANHTDPSRFLFAMSSPGGVYLAAIERADAPTFHIASRGAQGFGGASGAAGSDGASGGECSNGGDGGPGGDGGDGGPGGDGGDVLVDVVCGDGVCADSLALLSAIVRSEGGPGGEGGSGGPGGSGGAGGPSGPDTTTTNADGSTTTTPGCSAGSSGSSGPAGASGSAGPDGFAGHVWFHVAPRRGAGTPSK